MYVHNEEENGVSLDGFFADTTPQNQQNQNELGNESQENVTNVRKKYYLEIDNKDRAEMLDWAAHYIERGARITFFKGEKKDNGKKGEPCVFWDGLPKDESGQTVYWVNSEISYVSHMLDMGADRMKVNASDLARCAALEELGVSLANQGFRLAPIGGNKKAFWKCIDPVIKVKKDGSGTYETYSGAMDAHWALGTTPDQVRTWVRMGAPALAALCGDGSGGFYILDFDVDGFLDKFLEQNGVRDILEKHKVPIQRTGGGGWQICFRVEGEVPGNTKYAWSLNPDISEGREIAIESRGGPRGYGIMPNSLHPSGNYYEDNEQIFGGSFYDIPTISQDEFKTLESGASACCSSPHPTKADQPELTLGPKPKARKAPQTPQTPQANDTYIEDRLADAALAGDESVIDVVNDALDIGSTLEVFGYTPESDDRYSHPDATAGSGVSVLNNRSFHHSTNDRLHYDNELDGTHAPLADLKRTRTPFDVICAFQYQGNRREAVKGLAKQLGISHGKQTTAAPVTAPVTADPADQSFDWYDLVMHERLESDYAYAVPPPFPVAPVATAASVATAAPDQSFDTFLEDDDYDFAFSDSALADYEIEPAPEPEPEPEPKPEPSPREDAAQSPQAPPPPPDDCDYAQLVDMMPIDFVAPVVQYGELNHGTPPIEEMANIEIINHAQNFEDMRTVDQNIETISHESNIYREAHVEYKSFFVDDVTETSDTQKVQVWCDDRIDLSVCETPLYAEKTDEFAQYIVKLNPEFGYTSYVEYQSDNGVKVLIPDTDSEIGSIKTITRRNGEHNHVTFKHERYISGVWGVAMKHATLFGAGLLKAITGSGKTYEWAHYKGLSLLAVPTQALAKQVAKSYGVFPVYEDQDIDDMPADCPKIVSTYDSVRKVCEHLTQKQGEDLKEWNLTVDEAHLLTTEGGYRLKGINNLTSFFNDFGSVIAMSATLPLDLMRLTHFANAAFVECVPYTPRRKIKLLHTNRDYIAQTKQLLKMGIKLVIIHANDKSFCEAYRSQFEKEHIKTITFTADTKTEEHHDAIIQESKIDDDVRVVLTTNIFNVGLSIKPQESHAIIITHKSRLLPRDVCQVAARMRHGLEFQNPDFVLIANRRVDIDMSHSRKVFDYKDPYAEVFNQASRVLNLCEGTRELILEQRSASKTNLDEVMDAFHKNSFIKTPSDYTEAYQINVDGVVAYVSNIHRATLSTGQLLFELEETGLFEHHGEFEYQFDKADHDVKTKVKEVAARKKEKREETYERIIGGAASQRWEDKAVEELENVVENHKDHDTFEIEAAGGILSVFRTAEKLDENVRLGGVLKLAEGVKSKAGFKKLKQVCLFSVANNLTEKELEQMRLKKLMLVRRVLDCEISDDKVLKLCEMVERGEALRDIKVVVGVRVTRKQTQAIKQINKDTSVRQDALILRKLGQLVVPGEKLTKNEMEERRKKAFCLGISDMFDIRTSEKMTRLIKKFFKTKRSKKTVGGEQLHALEIIERIDYMPILTS